MLATNLSNGLPAVRGNPAQIRQVVMNLVTNASEAIGERDGVIRVANECVLASAISNNPELKGLTDGAYLRLEVTDNGSGMTPETLRRAFDPFFTTKFAGRGMGLAVVQQIVRGLGGTLHVTSSVGKGTSIRILMPCAEGSVSAKDGHMAARRRTDEVPAARTILIVEDEEALLVALSKLLKRKGFSVIQASNGSSALELIRDVETHIDAMLLDATLPGVPSRAVLEETRRLRPDLLAIVTSAYSRENVTVSLAGLTVKDFIRKPFHIEDLMVLLQQDASLGTPSVPVR